MPLLLSPYRLSADHIIVESLHVSKSAKGIDFFVNELDKSEIRKYYAGYDKEVREVLAWFNEEGMRVMKDQVKKTFQIQRGGVSFEIYSRKAIMRRLHELLLRLKPFAPQLKWYHKLKDSKGNFKTAPCAFSNYKPQLTFEVIKEGGGFMLQTNIDINGISYSSREFKRYQFLLESNNEYFFLSYKDYQTLDWLIENDPARYSNDAGELARQILARLEEDYPVNRNNLFNTTTINAESVKRVMLSEISNSFLVLTPQWFYDGFLAEGPWKEKTDMVRNGEAYTLIRDKESEAAFVMLLESLHPNFPRQMNGYYYLSFADAQKKQWFLKVYHRLLDLNIEVSGMDMLTHFRYSQHKVQTDMTIIREEHNTVFLDLRVSFGDDSVPLAELQKVLLAGQRAVMLKDGVLGVLHEEWLARYGMILRHAKISKKEVEVSRWLIFSLSNQVLPAPDIHTADPDDRSLIRKTAKDHHFEPAPENGWRQKWALWQQDDQQVYAVPATVMASLRPYQHRGYEWMLMLAEAGAGACLADDMGLGKTLQTICLLVHHSAKFPVARHLIISPSSLIYNWQQELKKFAPHISSMVYHGASRNAAALEDDKLEVIITSYGTVRADISILANIVFNTVVLDESHHIKNPSALITIAVSNLQAVTRIALSGTPVMNNTFDLYAQMNFLLPGVFGSREFFKREYADPIDRWHDAEKISALQKLTAPFILRRTKQQVAKDLPPKTETIMWCEMSGPQRELYNEIKDSIRSSLFLNIKKEGLNKSKLAVLQGILKLRQVCNSPVLLPEAEQTCVDSVKKDLLVDELTSNLTAHKVIVFSQFTGMLDLLGAAFRKEGLAYYHFDGQTPPLKRAEMVDAFQAEGNTTNIFLISLKAGNAGLNLTAADYVFLVDPWWNTAVQQQAIDRTHRIGQTKNVFAYSMICRDTIEEKIIQLQQRKKKLAEDLVSEDENFIKALTPEDVEFLFS